MPDTATRKEIKDGFRRLTKVWHPDVNRSPEAASKMKSLNEAYGTLSDDQKRSAYDEARRRRASRKLDRRPAGAASANSAPTPEARAAAPQPKRDPIGAASWVSLDRTRYRRRDYRLAQMHAKTALGFDPECKAAFYLLEVAQHKEHLASTTAIGQTQMDDGLRGACRPIGVLTNSTDGGEMGR